MGKPDEESNLSYEEICKTWAFSDHWPIEDAMRLVLRFSPRVLQQGVLTGEDELRLSILLAIAMNCVGETLSVINPKCEDGNYRVYPARFIEWLDEKNISCPDELRAEVDSAGSQVMRKRVKLRPTQEHMYMCRGVAAMLWGSDPNITIKAMSEKEELRYFGCDGRIYSPSTIYSWIKDVAPNHAPGRRAKPN